VDFYEPVGAHVQLKQCTVVLVCLTLPRTSFSCATSVARSARSLSRCSTVLRSTLISCRNTVTQ
jgi:hypothetical protein